MGPDLDRIVLYGQADGRIAVRRFRRDAAIAEGATYSAETLVLLLAIAPAERLDAVTSWLLGPAPPAVPQPFESPILVCVEDDFAEAQALLRLLRDAGDELGRRGLRLETMSPSPDSADEFDFPPPAAAYDEGDSNE